MPCIVSDFPFFGGVGFNLFYCYESPIAHHLVGVDKRVYTSCREHGIGTCDNRPVLSTCFIKKFSALLNKRKE